MANWFSDTFRWLVSVGKFFRATEAPPPPKAKLVELAAEKKRRSRKPKGAA